MNEIWIWRISGIIMTGETKVLPVPQQILHWLNWFETLTTSVGMLAVDHLSLSTAWKPWALHRLSCPHILLDVLSIEFTSSWSDGGNMKLYNLILNIFICSLYILCTRVAVNFTTESILLHHGFAAGSIAAQRLGLSSHLVSRVTGTIYIVQGDKNATMESCNKVNVGLNLKFNKRNEEVRICSWVINSFCDN